MAENVVTRYYVMDKSLSGAMMTPLRMTLNEMIDYHVEMIKKEIQEKYPEIKSFHVEHDKAFDKKGKLMIRISGVLPREA